VSATDTLRIRDKGRFAQPGEKKFLPSEQGRSPFFSSGARRGWWVTEIGGSLTPNSLHPTTPLLSLPLIFLFPSSGGEEKEIVLLLLPLLIHNPNCVQERKKKYAPLGGSLTSQSDEGIGKG